MKIYNVSSKTSIRMVVVMGILSTILTMFLTLSYLYSSPNSSSILDFFQWLFLLIKTFISEGEDLSEKIFLTIFSVIIPIAIYIGLIGAIISRNKALQEYRSGLNVKYVEFLPNRINFSFTQPQYNFSCGYNDIEKLNIELYTNIVHTKSGPQTVWNETIFNFYTLNNKKFKVNCVSFMLNKVYSVISYMRGIKELNYKFTGAGKILDLDDKISAFLKTGHKKFLGRNEKTHMMIISTVLFIFGTLISLIFLGTISDFGWLFIFIPAIIPLLISVVMDIVLFIDLINNRKFRGFNE